MHSTITESEIEEAVVLMLEKHEIVCELFHGFDYQRFFSATPREKMSTIPAAMDHIFQQEEGAQRCIQYVTELTKAFALAVPHEETDIIRDICDRLRNFNPCQSVSSAQSVFYIKNTGKLLSHNGSYSKKNNLYHR